MKDYRDEPQDKEWERISELLREADCVPDAPDCRSAVFARISPHPEPVEGRWRWRPVRLAWTYGSALAALVLVGIVAKPFILQPEIRKNQVANVAPARTAAPKAVKPEATAPKSVVTRDQVALAPGGSPAHQPNHRLRPKPVLAAANTPASDTKKFDSRTPVMAGVEARNPTMGRRTTGYGVRFDDSNDLAKSETPDKAKAMGSWSLDRGRAADAVETDARRPAMPASAPAAALGDTFAVADGTSAAGATAGVNGSLYFDSYAGGAARVESDSRPVAVAVVTWPSGIDVNTDSYSYGYSNRNTATGETTECKVKRTGNSVELYLESKPGPAEPPVKGSVGHETLPNA